MEQVQRARRETRGGPDVTVNVTVQFHEGPVFQYKGAVTLAQTPENGEPVQEFLAPITGADQVLATEPYFVLT